MVVTTSDTAGLDRLARDLDGSYAAFVRAHADAVYATALRLCASRADAEDIAQETFVRAYRSLRRFETARIRSLRARPWLLSITLNLWRNAARRASRHPEFSTPDVAAELADIAPGPDVAAEHAEDSRYLAALLAALPERQRVPVVLRHIAGLSHDDIAAALECPVGTAKSNVARGMARLRELADTVAVDSAVSGGAAVRRAAPRRPRPRRHALEVR